MYISNSFMSRFGFKSGIAFDCSSSWSLLFFYFYEETSIDEKSVVYSHSNDIPNKFAVYVKERQDRLPTMYWLPKVH